MLSKITVTITLLILFSVQTIIAGSSGSLSVSVTTQTYNGHYAPANCVAIWVEDNSGNFVKTLLVYAERYRTHLNTWQSSTSEAGSVYNSTDAITGASPKNHGTRTCSWNGTDFEGNEMADGTYKVWMEMTEDNATGKYKSISFTKGSSQDVQSLSGVSGFSTASVTWTPDVQTSVTTIKLNSYIKIYPTLSNGVYTIKNESSEEISNIKVATLNGNIVKIAEISNTLDITELPNGVYLVIVYTGSEKSVKRVIKQD